MKPPRKSSAGILLYRRSAGGVEFFLAHPGGPYYEAKDLGAWTVPKGEIEAGEDPLAVARREFAEETGQELDACAPGGGAPVALGSVVQRSGKTVHAWAVEGDWPVGAVSRSNTFELEWPPRSGERHEYPEIDRVEFFATAEARRRINPAQAAFIDRLLGLLDAASIASV